MNNILNHYRYCRICKSKNTTTVLKLKDTPLEDQFIEFPIEQPTYPLELALCKDCGYLYLPYLIDPEVSYSEYIYVSSVTVGLRNHYDSYARGIIHDYNISNGSLVVDLGSNDGSMLTSFKKLGMKIVGIEPATSIATYANGIGIPTINNFFTNQIASEILQDHGPAKVVTANYMFANINDIITFTKTVARILDKNGIFVIQTGYHPEQFKISMFDYIYHEHFSYFTVEVLRDLFFQCGLELIFAKKISPKGGSIRVVGQLKKCNRSISDTVSSLINDERTIKMRDPLTYKKFGEKIMGLKKELLELLNEIKRSGQMIIGFGASHSTTTLIYHFELGKYLEYLVDDNELKHNLYSPGHHLKVFPSEKLYKDKPNYVLVLGWQHQDSIINRNKKFLEDGGKFIVPLPTLKMIYG